MTFILPDKYNCQNVWVYPFQSCFFQWDDYLGSFLQSPAQSVKLSLWSEPQLSALKETSFCNSLVTKLFVNCIWPKLHFFLNHQKYTFCELSKAIDIVEMSLHNDVSSFIYCWRVRIILTVCAEWNKTDTAFICTEPVHIRV